MKKIANRGYAAMDRRMAATHSGRPIVQSNGDGPIWVRCCKGHLVELIPRADWESHWLYPKVNDDRFNIECSIQS